jgi:hypothetical protein
MPVTDEELRGMALQALNMAKRELERGKPLGCFMATHHAGENIHRMDMVEKLLAEKLGEDWLNDEDKKDIGFGLMRQLLGVAWNNVEPPDAFIIVTEANRFEPTKKMQKLPQEEQLAIANGGHAGHHRAVREGYFKLVDCLHALAQTPERVCLYVQPVDPPRFVGQPRVEFFDQKNFGGRLKMYGDA